MESILLFGLKTKQKKERENEGGDAPISKNGGNARNKDGGKYSEAENMYYIP